MTNRCPVTTRQIVDKYFIENRHRVLDIAAFLDRLDRSRDGADPDGNFRMILSTGFRTGLTLYPNTKVSYARAVDIVEMHGAERMYVNSAWTGGTACLLPFRRSSGRCGAGATRRNSSGKWCSTIPWSSCDSRPNSAFRRGRMRRSCSRKRPGAMRRQSNSLPRPWRNHAQNRSD